MNFVAALAAWFTLSTVAALALGRWFHIDEPETVTGPADNGGVGER